MDENETVFHTLVLNGERYWKSQDIVLWLYKSPKAKTTEMAQYLEKIIREKVRIE